MRRRTAAFLILLFGCGHSESGMFTASPVGPLSSGADVLLTNNAEQDYWPAWTQDGQGILYAYVDQSIPPGLGHRCIGMLPAAGGTRIWQMCDQRATQVDSVSSFGAFAVAPDGRLLYAEAVASKRTPLASGTVSLWLADTAKPFARTALLTLPVTVGSNTVTWLSELEWIDATTFVVLGQVFETTSHSNPLTSGQFPTTDTLFTDSTSNQGAGTRTATGIVLRGTISGMQATLQPITGTDGATGYSRTSDGATIAFVRRDDRRVFSVPMGGGTATVVGTLTTAQGQLVGISCRVASCLVATNPMTLFYGGAFAPIYPSLAVGARELRSISLTTGATQTVWSSGGVTGPIVATPRISPVSGDVVVQVGGVWGHLQTFSSAASDLHLLHGLVF